MWCLLYVQSGKKRTKNSFMLFRDDVYDDVKKKYPNLKVIDVRCTSNAVIHVALATRDVVLVMWLHECVLLLFCVLYGVDH